MCFIAKNDKYFKPHNSYFRKYEGSSTPAATTTLFGFEAVEINLVVVAVIDVEDDVVVYVDIIAKLNFNFNFNYNFN